MTSIGDYTFWDCTSLTSITIPDGVTSIEWAVFSYCTSLTSVTIPNSVTSIGYSAFGDCAGLTDVYYTGTEDEWWNLVISGTSNNNECLTNATIHYNQSAPVHTHSYTSTITKQPTCTEPGVQTYICKCGETYTEVIPALGHDFSNEWTIDVEPTCTTAGSKSHHCSSCEAKSDVTEIPATGHKFVDKTIAPTYDAEGYTEHTCSVCGYSYRDNYTPKKERADISKATVTVAATSVYTGKALKPTVTVKLGGKTLKSGTDYTVAYKSNTNCGKANITITGKGNYTGTKTATFIIKPAKTTISSVKSPKTKQIKVKWKKSAGGVTGHEVMIATNKKFSKNKKTYTVSGTSTTSKTITGLKKGTTYYAKVRAYKTVGKTKYYGAWSAVKSVKTK